MQCSRWACNELSCILQQSLERHLRRGQYWTNLCLRVHLQIDSAKRPLRSAGGFCGCASKVATEFKQELCTWIKCSNKNKDFFPFF